MKGMDSCEAEALQQGDTWKRIVTLADKLLENLKKRRKKKDFQKFQQT